MQIVYVHRPTPYVVCTSKHRTVHLPAASFQWTPTTYLAARAAKEWAGREGSRVRGPPRGLFLQRTKPNFSATGTAGRRREPDTRRWRGDHDGTAESWEARERQGRLNERETMNVDGSRSARASSLKGKREELLSRESADIVPDEQWGGGDRRVPSRAYRSVSCADAPS